MTLIDEYVDALIDDDPTLASEHIDLRRYCVAEVNPAKMLEYLKVHETKKRIEDQIYAAWRAHIRRTGHSRRKRAESLSASPPKTTHF